MFDHARLDEWWEPLRYQNKFEQVKVPVLHISGWYDDEQVGTPLNFIGMTSKGATPEIRRQQKLLMGRGRMRSIQPRSWAKSISARPR